MSGPNYDYGFILCVPMTRPMRPEWDIFHAWNRPRHYGDDLPCLHRAVVVAAADGEVAIARSGWKPGEGDAGNTVDILHPGPVDRGGSPMNWYRTRYLHLDEVTVAVGDSVTQGQIIGYAGDTGSARYPHVHHDIRFSDDPDANLNDVWGSYWGTAYDPEDFGILLTEPEEPVMTRVSVDRPVLKQDESPFTVRQAVKDLQFFLNVAGKLDLTPGLNFDPDTLDWDGKHGESTDEAVRAYQESKGLVVDGIVGAATWTLMLDY